MRHFKVNPVLKIDETVYKQAKSMCPRKIKGTVVEISDKSVSDSQRYHVLLKNARNIHNFSLNLMNCGFSEHLRNVFKKY